MAMGPSNKAGFSFIFIGQNLNQAAITHALDNCLLSDDELLAGKALWQTLPDPFPVWEEA